MLEKRGVFERAVKHSKDISASYAHDFGRSYFEQARKIDSQVLSRMRTLMTKRIKLINDVVDADAFLAARARIVAGEVAAVDGTNAVPPLTGMNATIYASAVAWTTTKERSKATHNITAAVTPIAELHDFDDLRVLAKQLNEIRLDQSWPTTFREYYERQAALECQAPIVLIDGPIFTQNLMTQERYGQEILEDIAKSDRMFIGVIKDLRGSWAESKWAAYSLETGEVYEVGLLADEWRDRFESQRGVLDWAERHGKKFSRYVYRPGAKAFGFECRQSDFREALAILMANASATIGHETPLLLELVDARLRAEINGVNARNALIGPIWGAERSMAFDLSDERELR